MKPFDPTKVAEATKRMSAAQSTLSVGTAAGRALAWFDNFALRPTDVASDTIKITTGLVAASTSDVEYALKYVSTAAQGFHQAILDKAIELALADHQAAAAKMAP